MGLRDIWARSQWGREATGAELLAACRTFIKADASPPSGRMQISSVNLDEYPLKCVANHRHVAPRMPFLIEAWIINHLMTSFAHFT
jgi:hypothetical protein